MECLLSRRTFEPEDPADSGVSAWRRTCRTSCPQGTRRGEETLRLPLGVRRPRSHDESGVSVERNTGRARDDFHTINHKNDEGLPEYFNTARADGKVTPYTVKHPDNYPLPGGYFWNAAGMDLMQKGQW